MPVVDVDQLAGHLEYMGVLAKNMPPAWDGAKVRNIVKSPTTGGYLGYMLPGKGLQLDMDLKYLGIHKSIPHVYERTLLAKCYDLWLRPEKTWREDYQQVIDPERGAITTYDGIINSRAGGKANDIVFAKVASGTTVANQWFCNALLGGMPGAMTFNSTTAPTQTACDRSTTGNLGFPLFNPGGTDKKYLLTFGWGCTNQVNMGILCDLQVQGGSFRLTVTTAETVASPVTIPRTYYSPLGAGNYVILVATTTTSATATTVTVTYVDQDNNAAQTFTSVGAAVATNAGSIFPTSGSSTMPFNALAAGDYGVRSFSQCQSSVALAAGVLAGLIVAPLVFLPGIAANAYIERDSTVQIDGLTELANVSQTIGALTLLCLPSTTTVGAMTGFMRTCAG